MIENIAISVIVTLAIGFPLSIYAGVIVARYISYDMAVNDARSLILDLEQEWEFRYLDKPIPDPESPSGKRTVFMSHALAANSTSWRLTQVGLVLKELGHWKPAIELDRIGMEMDELRNEILEKAQLQVEGDSVGVLEYIADWHRRISAHSPYWWSIVKPWPHSKYKSLSCIHVDEARGEWHEIEAKRKKTMLDDPTIESNATSG